MLNYETLLSSYDDKLTLMQWLKKVEKALAGASASSFEVIKTGNATIHFRINFEDGTYLESGDIVLQQGESVSSGEIRNGHLYLTLTNGQELDCGTLFNGEIPNMQVRSLEVTGGLILGSDANAAIGGDLVVHGLTEVQNLLAYGHVETETLTAAGDQITAEKPVVEVMQGYGLTLDPSYEKLTMEFLYGGVVKNGNKLTLALSANITRLDSITTYGEYQRLGKFSLPIAVGSRIVPAITQSSYGSIVGGLKVACIKTDATNQEFVSIDGFLQYESNTSVAVMIKGLNSLALNAKYYIRFEMTILLSENLIE